MEKNKPLFYRVVACFCAFMICVCLTVFAFMIPPKAVKATSIYDQWEDWVDDRLFEGSSFWIEEFVSKGIENMAWFWTTAAAKVVWISFCPTGREQDPSASNMMNIFTASHWKTAAPLPQKRIFC